MSYHGGPLIANIQAEAMYYSPWNTNSTLQTQKATLDSFFPYITNSTYMDLLSEYSAGGTTIGHGTFSGDDTNFPTATTNPITINGNTYNAIDESQIRSDLSAEINAGGNGLTTPNGNTLYFVFTPPGVVVTSGSSNSVNDFVAFHNWFHDGPSGQDVFYAVMPYADGNPNAGFFPLPVLQVLQEAATHEMAEAVTDPKLNAWYDNALGTAGEIGDLSNAEWSTLNGYVVQNEFSNAANASIMATGTNFYISSFSNPTEGQFNGPIATFVDTSGSGNLSFAAVDWGDDTFVTVPTTVQQVNSTTFNLIASHTYNADEGTSFNLRVFLTLADGSQAKDRGRLNIKDNANGDHFYTDKGLVTLTDAPLTPIPVTVPATEGQGLNNQLVAKFNDPGTDGTNGDYTATITWDDGNGNTHISTGTVSLASGTTFNVFGTNNVPYGEEGSRAITVVVTDSSGNTVTIFSTAQVSDPSVSASGVSFGAVEGLAFTNQAVATFTDPGGAEPNASDPTPGISNHYTASIKWGDGTPNSTGTITFNSMTGKFTVSGNHTYAAAGSYTITTIINHEVVMTNVMSAGTVANLGTFVQGTQTKPTNWWAGLLGKELIGKFGLTAGGHTLGQWLATTFPNLYGGGNGAPNLNAFSNTQVSDFYTNQFKIFPTPTLIAEVMATALDVFATTLSLGGTVGQGYGFLVNAFGLGAYSYNIGFNGPAFGVPNLSILNVYQILLAANNNAVGGNSWGSNLILRNQGLSVFKGINGEGQVF